MGGNFRQVHRKPGATHNHLGAAFYGGLHQLLVVGQGYHYIYANDTIRSDRVGLAEFGLERLCISLKIIFPIIEPTIESDARCSYQPDTAALCNDARQTAG